MKEPKPAPKRCRALNRDGSRCRKTVWPGGEGELCFIHQRTEAPGPLPKPEARWCSALNKAGQRCGMIAAPDTNPPLCPAHAGTTPIVQVAVEPEPHEALMTVLRPACSARNRKGGRCLAPSIRGSEPPLCRHHFKRARTGERPAPEPVTLPEWEAEDEEEVEKLGVGAREGGRLHTELRVVRGTLRRVVAALNEEATPGEVARLAGAVLRSASVVAALVKVGEELGEDRRQMKRAIQQAVVELGEEWGIDLRGDGEAWG